MLTIVVDFSLLNHLDSRLRVFLKFCFTVRIFFRSLLIFLLQNMLNLIGKVVFFRAHLNRFIWLFLFLFFNHIYYWRISSFSYLLLNFCRNFWRCRLVPAIYFSNVLKLLNFLREQFSLLLMTRLLCTKINFIWLIISLRIFALFYFCNLTDLVFFVRFWSITFCDWRKLFFILRFAFFICGQVDRSVHIFHQLSLELL